MKTHRKEESTIGVFDDILKVFVCLVAS